ncbi:MAG TPA: glycine cleavage system aminomethyltransferase GcvT, partial [Alphaproteobacteria bacterium]|nr:glycine cleavage system aminomethyltransferase GcvT [Alphaproteobacteria bacterium]
MPPDALLRTPLTDLHRRLGARLVPFAGYEMPVQYPAGIMKEHLHTRAAAGLFDVSHMGQIRISGPEAAARLESLVVGDMKGIAPGRQRYTLFTNAQGGILDDLMVANFGDHLLLVVNAGTKHDDLAHLRANLAGLTVEPLFDRALIALQGPAAAAVLSRHLPEVATMPFMAIAAATLFGVPVTVSRSGYTGEDGYEIGIPGEAGEMVAERLLAEPEVEAIGLGARDSLRLEAGLCLYGHDIDTTTTPVEAGLTWAMPKRRREEGGFPGAEVVRAQLAEGPRRKRVGLKLDGRQ